MRDVELGQNIPLNADPVKQLLTRINNYLAINNHFTNLCKSAFSRCCPSLFSQPATAAALYTERDGIKEAFNLLTAEQQAQVLSRIISQRNKSLLWFLFGFCVISAAPFAAANSPIDDAVQAIVIMLGVFGGLGFSMYNMFNFSSALNLQRQFEDVKKEDVQVSDCLCSVNRT